MENILTFMTSNELAVSKFRMFGGRLINIFLRLDNQDLNTHIRFGFTIIFKVYLDYASM